MRRAFRVYDIDYFSSVNKIEQAINKLPEVQAAEVRFPAGRIFVDSDTDDWDALEAKIAEICNEFMNECSIEATEDINFDKEGDGFTFDDDLEDEE